MSEFERRNNLFERRRVRGLRADRPIGREPPKQDAATPEYAAEKAHFDEVRREAQAKHQAERDRQERGDKWRRANRNAD